MPNVERPTIVPARIVHCTGSNSSGQLGSGGFEPVFATPPDHPALGPIRSLAVARDRTCVITDADDRLLCWGAGVPIDGVIGAPVPTPSEVLLP